MTPAEQLGALPSANLGHWPTPFHRLDRFSEAVGAEVWIKRDDVQGAALAGNKIRKFNLVLGQALADGVDTIVTTGAIQSNSARTGAVAAAALGMEAHLVLGGSAPAEPQANLLIDHLVGANLHFTGDATWEERNRCVDDLVERLNAEGRNAVGAPVGCSSPLGALGFAQAFVELEAQVAAAGISPTAVVHTTSSGGTHSGLLVGRALSASMAGIPVIGVDVGRMYPDMAQVYVDLALEAAVIIGLDLPLATSDVQLIDQTGEAYAVPTPEGDEAVRLLAQTEGILVDPVYSGKGLAGLISLVRNGQLDGPVVFWHTGGYHALFDSQHGSPLIT